MQPPSKEKDLWGLSPGREWMEEGLCGMKELYEMASTILRGE